MPNIKLIMSDIDGTIMPRGNAAVSERTRAAFRAAIDAGIAAGPASGRSISQIPAFFSGDAACCATCIATNGLEAYHAGERICSCPPPRVALERLLAELDGIDGAGLAAFDGAQPYLCSGPFSGFKAVVPAYAQIVRPVQGLPEFEILKANVFLDTDMAGTQALCDRLNRAIDGLDFDVPMRGFLNIMPTGWNKGSALRALCEHLGISVDEVVVFGDAGNDLAMFRVAGHPVAVGNATEEARAAARWHIGRCEDDAVAAAIEAIVAGDWPFTE